MVSKVVHLNFKSLNKLVSQNIVIGLPRFTMPDKMCGGCLVDKKYINLFKASLPMRSSNVLEFVHSDVGDLLRRKYYGEVDASSILLMSISRRCMSIGFSVIMKCLIYSRSYRLWL